MKIGNNIIKRFQDGIFSEIQGMMLMAGLTAGTGCKPAGMFFQSDICHIEYT